MIIVIHRGTHQIGGVAAEVRSGGERVLVDLGANLPDTDSPITDDQLVQRAFAQPCKAVLFTHYHGDHVGLYRRVPQETEMFIGPTAKKILSVVAEYAGGDVRRMKTYRPGIPLKGFERLKITPLAVDHSAMDAVMLLIEAEGRRVLFTGDFRDHGVTGSRLWRMVEKYIEPNIDLLVTEGTALYPHVPLTERELGARARAVFAAHKYNFVLVSSANLDSVISFFLNSGGKPFICDLYQARLLMIAMEARGLVLRVPRTVYLTGRLRQDLMEGLFRQGKRVGVSFRKARAPERGFVMLARPNRYPERGSTPFETSLKAFCEGAFITYSLWTGYLPGGVREDAAVARFLSEHPYEVLHTGGHASPEAIARLIRMTDPRLIVPMHTERADDFASAFAPWAGRIRVLQDGEELPL